jgi:hypothetical protein
MRLGTRKTAAVKFKEAIVIVICSRTRAELLAKHFGLELAVGPKEDAGDADGSYCATQFPRPFSSSLMRGGSIKAPQTMAFGELFYDKPLYSQIHHLIQFMTSNAHHVRAQRSQETVL